MKFRVTMKDPDTLYDAAEEAAKVSLQANESLDENEIATLLEGRTEGLTELAATWFEYGEYLTVEIDTDAKTCVVVPTSE